MPTRFTVPCPVLCLIVLLGLPLLFLPVLVAEVQASEALDARDLLRRGTTEAGLAAGFWQAFNPGDVQTANRSSVFVLPRLGRVMSDEFKAGLFSGNIELLAEPFFARFTQPFAAEAAGGTVNVKFNLVSFGRWVPFWDFGAGLMWTNLAPRIWEQSTPVNFVIQTGPGVHYFFTRQVALTAGIRLHHVSNADIGRRNEGLNATLSYVGLSFFFDPS